MTVEELIAELQKRNPKGNVTINVRVYGAGFSQRVEAKVFVDGVYLFEMQTPHW